MQTALMSGGIVLFVILIICAIKESRTTALFKAFGVYGRFKAYLFIDLFFAGIALVIGAFVSEDAMGIGSKPLAIIVGVVCVALAVLIYITTKRKCPVGLRGRLLISMLISGWGVAFKVAIFFVFVVWRMMMPVEATDEDGNTIYIHGSDVYNSQGERIGTRDGSNTFIREK